MLQIVLDSPIAVAGQRLSGSVHIPPELQPCSPPVVHLTGLLSIRSTRSDNGSATVERRLLCAVQSVAALSGSAWKFSLHIPSSLPPSFVLDLSDEAASQIAAQYTVEAVTSPVLAGSLESGASSATSAAAAATSAAAVDGATPESRAVQECRSLPLSVQVESHPEPIQPLGADESLPLGTDGVISLGFSAPHAALVPDRHLRASVCVRNDSNVAVQHWHFEMVAVVRLDDAPSTPSGTRAATSPTYAAVGGAFTDATPLPWRIAFDVKLPVQLVTYGSIGPGETAAKRIPAYLVPTLPPSVLCPAVGLEIEYVVQVTATTASGKTFRAQSTALRLLHRSFSDPSDESLPTSLDIDEWVAGLVPPPRLSAGSLSQRRSIASESGGSMVSMDRRVSTVRSPGAAGNSLSRMQPSPSARLAEIDHELETLFEGNWKCLVLDQWVEGTVGFQKSAQFYFDYEEDLVMEHTNDSYFGDGASSQGSRGGSPVVSNEHRGQASAADGNGQHGAAHDASAQRGGSMERASRGIPGVILVSNTAVGVRISKAPNRPSWLFYEKAEESRSLLPDGSEEIITRFMGGYGRYYVAVFGNTFNSGARFELAVRRIQGLKDSDPFRFLSFWLSCTVPAVHAAAGSLTPSSASSASSATSSSQPAAPMNVPAAHRIPHNAWQTGHDLSGEPLFSVRVHYKGGLHLGKMGPHLAGPSIPWGGKEIVLPAGTEYEVLSEIPGTRWVTVLSGAGVPPNAIPCGHEADGLPLYVARTTVKESVIPGLLGAAGGSRGWMGSMLGGILDGRTSQCPGKAGPHMHGCNVSFGGSELNSLTPFEVLVYDEPPAFGNSNDDLLVMDAATAALKGGARLN
ncbi:hypothetical protein BC831DRAFT_512950 [Entophlyctis helioformis]|nr:hypothetical protein BC831DRAFT_512950 [Entophlyctis helioformis]